LQHDGAAVFKLLDQSPLPPALSAKDLPGGQTQILNVRQIQRINLLTVKSDEDSAPESILDTEDRFHWNGDLDDPNDSKDDCMVNLESDIDQENSIEGPDCPMQRDVCATPNIPGLIWPTWTSQSPAEQVFVTVNAIETRRIKGVKKM
jgi:hypothetical protein